jgi:hypothetical protein
MCEALFLPKIDLWDGQVSNMERLDSLYNEDLEQRIFE